MFPKFLWNMQSWKKEINKSNFKIGPPKVRKEYCTQSLSEKHEEFYYVFYVTVWKKTYRE